jgi:hypothetical protein
LPLGNSPSPSPTRSPSPSPVLPVPLANTPFHKKVRGRLRDSIRHSSRLNPRRGTDSIRLPRERDSIWHSSRVQPRRGTVVGRLKPTKDRGPYYHKAVPLPLGNSPSPPPPGHPLLGFAYYSLPEANTGVRGEGVLA